MAVAMISASATTVARPASLLLLLRRAAIRTTSSQPHITRARAAAFFCTTPQIRSPASSNTTTNTNTTSPPPPPHDSNTNNDAAAAATTHFGFQDGLSEAEKTERVAGVFHSVAESYDRMNDLMSFGWHRIWKDHFVRSLNPGSSAPSSPPAAQHILDVAGGTGDIAFRMLHHAHAVNRNPDVRVTITDINGSMLAVGAQRAAAQLPASQQAALSFLEWDATRPFPAPPAAPPSAPSSTTTTTTAAATATTGNLSPGGTTASAGIAPSSIDLYTVAFGIRNFSSVRAGLAEAYRVLKPGGVFACLEFSRVDESSVPIPLLGSLFAGAYSRWSFGAIPLIGQLAAGDRDSYQYLVESIARFPSQEEFRGMIEEAGFVVGGRGYENLTGGVAAVHKGLKPL